MDQIIDTIGGALIQLLGLEGVGVMALLVVVSMLAQLVGKAIPDDSVGALGVIRRVAKVVGLYVNNRVTKDTDVTDPARQMMGNASARVR